MSMPEKTSGLSSKDSFPDIAITSNEGVQNSAAHELGAKITSSFTQSVNASPNESKPLEAERVQEMPEVAANPKQKAIEKYATEIFDHLIDAETSAIFIVEYNKHEIFCEALDLAMMRLVKYDAKEIQKERLNMRLDQFLAALVGDSVNLALNKIYWASEDNRWLPQKALLPELGVSVKAKAVAWVNDVVKLITPEMLFYKNPILPLSLMQEARQTPGLKEIIAPILNTMLQTMTEPRDIAWKSQACVLMGLFGTREQQQRFLQNVKSVYHHKGPREVVPNATFIEEIDTDAVEVLLAEGFQLEDIMRSLFEQLCWSTLFIFDLELSPLTNFEGTLAGNDSNTQFEIRTLFLSLLLEKKRFNVFEGGKVPNVDIRSIYQRPEIFFLLPASEGSTLTSTSFLFDFVSSLAGEYFKENKELDWAAFKKLSWASFESHCEESERLDLLAEDRLELGFKLFSYLYENPLIYDRLKERQHIPILEAALRFAQVVFYSDELTQMKESDKNSHQARFFEIAKQLPMELQQELALKQAGLGMSHIPQHWVDWAFRYLAAKEKQS